MLVAFVDTNVTLHYPPLSQIDWCKICGAEAVRLMFCMPVIDELDRKKSEGGLGTRAATRLREIEAGQGKEIARGVTLDIQVVAVRSSDFPDTLSPDTPDDRIVHCAKLYQREHAEDEVVVVSEDTGMRVRCRAHNVRDVRPPQNIRLPNPKTEEQVENEKLKRELIDLKNKSPRLELTFDPGTDHVHKLTRPKLVNVDAERQKYEELARDRRQFNYQPNEYGRLLTTVTTRLTRNNAIRDESARTIRVKATLTNAGHAPAQGISLTLKFPDVICAVVYQSFLDGERTLLVPGDHAREILGVRLPDHEASLPHVFDRSRTLYIGSIASRVFHLDHGYLAHRDSFPVPEFFVTFASWDAVKPFEVAVSIRTLDPPNMQEFPVLVRAAIEGE